MHKVLFGLALCVCTSSALASPSDADAQPVEGEADAAEPLTLQEKMDLVLQEPFMEGAEVGGLVWNLETGEELWSHQADVPINPASVQKVITTLAVLEHLGPKTTLVTHVNYDGTITDGVLEGNLYMVGGGDPTMVIERLWKLAADVYAAGVERVTGDLIVDPSILGDGSSIPGWAGGTDTDRAPPYEAPISGFPLNYNSVTVLVQPGKEVGASSEVRISVPDSYFSFENTALTGEPGSKTSLEVARKDSNIITVSGSIASDASSHYSYLSVDKPTPYVAHSFKSLFETLGGSIEGEVKSGKTPTTVERLVTHRSDPVGFQLSRMNAYSNNQIAEQLLRLAARKALKDGSSQGAVRLLEKTLKDHGISLEGAKFYNGSGLARNARLTAKQVAAVYNALYHHPKWQWEGLSSLSIYGLPGGVQPRNKEAEYLGYVRLKPGTIQGVLTLSGILFCEDEDEAYGFVLLSQKLKRAWPARDSWEGTMQAVWEQCPTPESN
ncbi:MAG: D-alanyl-D-alanine carboxypeptidase/D-alanyl-D-alanine-endopeptidase [Deltaproteobacteria bacterium]|nr:D-alanyl-D-alanine carboxypeptidase/D-alanyl-D-alanine-endopeptidase [Deltaproteobacteria bacterium]